MTLKELRDAEDAAWAAFEAESAKDPEFARIEAACRSLPIVTRDPRRAELLSSAWRVLVQIVNASPVTVARNAWRDARKARTEAERAAADVVSTAEPPC